MQGNFMGRPGAWHGDVLPTVPLFLAKAFQASASNDESHLPV